MKKGVYRAGAEGWRGPCQGPVQGGQDAEILGGRGEKAGAGFEPGSQILVDVSQPEQGAEAGEQNLVRVVGRRGP